jgi:hypothetical protein
MFYEYKSPCSGFKLSTTLVVIGGVAYLEGDNLEVFYYVNASEIWAEGGWPLVGVTL